MGVRSKRVHTSVLIKLLFFLLVYLLSAICFFKGAGAQTTWIKYLIRDNRMEACASSSALLYKPSASASSAPRSHVPLLNCSYETYTHAHHAVLSDWLEGKVGTGAPSGEEEQCQIRSVNSIPALTQCVEQKLDTEVQRVYDQLVNTKVPNHFKIVTSHRKWIRLTHEFCKLAGVEFSPKMADAVRVHDLSKYTDGESLGYAVMFGDEQIDFKPLEKDDEKLEWQTTLNNHYISNPHHPEYFYPKKADGQRDKAKSMEDLDPVDGKLYLQESLVDMLASRGERNLKEDPEVSVTKWMDIPERYMMRYAQSDKEYVMGQLDEWREMALRFVKDREQPLTGHFDDRPIVE